MKYIWFGHRTDIAVVLLIVVSLGIGLFQTAETVDHYTWDHVREDNLHKDNVDCIEGESTRVDLVHVISDGTTCVDLEHTPDYVCTWFCWNVVLVDNGGVGVEGDDVEDKDEASCKSR